jgi:hypothetical protein
VLGAPQVSPHSLQLSMVPSATQRPLHSTRPDTSHWHEPATQVAPVAQLCPQPPQLFSSVCVSTQVLRQTLSPLRGHEQWPVWQLVGPVQIRPHAPQLSLSFCSEMQVPPQQPSPVAQPAPLPHMQLPPLLQVSSTGQLAPLPHWHVVAVPVSVHVSFVGQPLLPNTPELSVPASVSLTWSPGTPLHIAATQLLFLQLSVLAQVLPQAPQLL